MFQNKIQFHNHSKSTSSWNVILLKDMGEGEAFTVLFSKVTAADIKKKKKKNQDFAFDMAQVCGFFLIKGQRTE